MPAFAFPLLLAVAVAVAIAPTTHALTCKAFFQQNTDKYDKQQLPTHECSHSELGDCSVDGLAANHCVPFRRAGQGTGAVPCFATQSCPAARCFTARRARDGRVYAGCETHWDSSPAFGHGAAMGAPEYPGGPWGSADAYVKKFRYDGAPPDGVWMCSDKDLCNDGGGRVGGGGAGAIAVAAVAAAWLAAQR